MNDDFLPGGRFSQNLFGGGARPFAVRAPSDLWRPSRGFNDGTLDWRIDAMDERRRAADLAFGQPTPFGQTDWSMPQRAARMTPRLTMDGTGFGGFDLEWGHSDPVARVMAGLAPAREVLAAPGGAPQTAVSFHGGLLKAAFGRQRIEVSVRAGSAVAVVAGTLVDLGGTAELDRGVLYVPRKLRDEVLRRGQAEAERLRAAGQW